MLTLNKSKIYSLRRDLLPPPVLDFNAAHNVFAQYKSYLSDLINDRKVALKVLLADT